MRTDLWGVLGALFGVLLAPFVFLGGLLRRARVFHPDGQFFRGRVIATPAADPRVQRVAARLAGFVLARLSASVHAGPEEVPDWLGGGFRFRADAAPTAVAGPGDQDVLLASLESFLSTQKAKRETDHHDYLNNTYYTVAPYLVDGVGKARVRLVGSRLGPRTGPRSERLKQAAAAGEAWFRLEVQPRGEADWLAVARIELDGPTEIDMPSWYMTPFRAGRGLTPCGVIHGIRLIVYPVGRLARRLRGV